LFQNDKKCRLKISIGCVVFGSGCFGLRYRFGNPRLRHCERSEAISKGIATIPHQIASGLVPLKRRAHNNILKRRRGSAGGSLRSPPPSASLTRI